MPPTTPPPGINFVIWLIVLVAIGTMIMVLFKVAVWWGERYGITSSQDEDEPVRGGSRTGSWNGSTGSGDPVRAQQNQLEPDFDSVREPAHEPSTLRSLTRTEEIALLAVQRNDDGSYRHSANKICELMGGTAAEVKAQVAAIRGPAKPVQAPGAPLKRPANGWGG